MGRAGCSNTRCPTARRRTACTATGRDGPWRRWRPNGQASTRSGHWTGAATTGLAGIPESTDGPQPGAVRDTPALFLVHVSQTGLTSARRSSMALLCGLVPHRAATPAWRGSQARSFRIRGSCSTPGPSSERIGIAVYEPPARDAPKVPGAGYSSVPAISAIMLSGNSGSGRLPAARHWPTVASVDAVRSTSRPGSRPR